MQIKNGLLFNEYRSHSFLQLSVGDNSDVQSPKMKCGCKFIKDSEAFLKDNLKALENTLSPGFNDKPMGKFIELKSSNNLIENSQSKINSKYH